MRPTSRQPSICSPRSMTASPGGRSRVGPSWPPRIARSIPTWKRFAAKRMGATTVELKSSHVPMLSHPKQVLDVIRTAAAAVQRSTAAQGV